MEDVNRLKIVLVEKKKNKQVACRTVGCKPFNCLQMVYQYITTAIGHTYTNISTFKVEVTELIRVPQK